LKGVEAGMLDEKADELLDDREIFIGFPSMVLRQRLSGAPKFAGKAEL